MEVLRRAFAQTQSAIGYINRVGHEEITMRKHVRRACLGRYDEQYDPPLPMMTGTVISPTGQAQKPIDFIVDTAADLTILRGKAADELGLWPFGWDEAEIVGIGAAPQRRTLDLAGIQLNGEGLTITVDCRHDLTENILGRDVFNEFELIVCAKKSLVSF